MIILIIFAFISGLVTIFAPCIWPLLPIILSSTTIGGHRRPLGITLGIVTMFTIFNLSISYLVALFHFDPNILRIFSVIIIGLLGVAMVIPALLGRLEGMVSTFVARFGGNSGQPTTTGFWGGFITGASLGVIWTPCAGPILATIVTLASTQTLNSAAIFLSLSYAAGVGVPLFIFSYLGQKLFTKSRLLNKYTGRIQQIFGTVMILTAIAIATNYDKILQAKLLDSFPAYSDFVVNLESNSAVTKELNNLKGSTNSKPVIETITEENQIFNVVPSDAPEFTGITNWLNTDQPITMSKLKGKVILIDFWTYTCINCIRTLPYVTSWYEKYKNNGFIVIGVHTPEFEFEKNTANVEKALAQYKITYPVPQDNDYATWQAFDNQFWPAHYLIDMNGKVRRVHFGEGEYEEMEEAIQLLLKERGESVSDDKLDLEIQSPSRGQSHETYLGSNRMEYLFPNGKVNSGVQTFSLPSRLPENSFSFGGTWNIVGEHAISGKNAVIEYNFTAKKVFLVLRPGEKNSKSEMKVYLDGKLVSKEVGGEDVKNGIVIIDSDRLYTLIELNNVESHILKLEFITPGTEAYAFTFG